MHHFSIMPCNSAVHKQIRIAQSFRTIFPVVESFFSGLLHSDVKHFDAFQNTSIYLSMFAFVHCECRAKMIREFAPSITFIQKLRRPFTGVVFNPVGCGFCVISQSDLARTISLSRWFFSFELYLAIVFIRMPKLLTKNASNRADFINGDKLITRCFPSCKH